MTIQELSGYIRIPVKTLYNWRWRGEGPKGFRVGNTLLYEKKDVDDWLAGQKAADEFTRRTS